ncbi:Rpp14 family protein [Xylariaceae sp. FL0255]|nr:Rpp14 family protein [Xylariaceae sp. FL0255]
MVRIKERYLLVNILYPSKLGTKPELPDVVVVHQPTSDQLTVQNLLRAIRTEVATLFGDYGSGALEGGNMSIKYLSPATSTFIIKISRAAYRFVWTALTFMDCVPIRNGEPCVFRVVHVSGTIRKVEEEAVRRARKLIFEAQCGQVEKSSDSLSNIFGTSKRPQRNAVAAASEDEGSASDVEMAEVGAD